MRTLVIPILLVLSASGCATPGGLFGPESDEEIWAIRCGSARGATRQKLARSYADALRKVSGLRSEHVQVIDEDEEAVIYYGRYRRYFDAQKQQERYEPDHAHDMELIRNLTIGGQDAWPFLMATIEPLPLKSALNPAWDFENADGYWALHVAVFYNTEAMRRRRFAAEEYCKVLRGEGREAYFHHGSTNSSVYIGMFPKDSVREMREQDRITGEVVWKWKIIDPLLIELQRQYPHTIHNGHVYKEVYRDSTTGEVKQRIPYASTLGVAPRAERAAQTPVRTPKPADPWRP